MMAAALSYAKQGLKIFPCEKKMPVINSGFKAATSDEPKIREWWTRWPTAQIALPTGTVNHLFVIDIDGPDGAAAVAKMNLAETKTVETSPGHFQFWFSQPEGVKTKCSASVVAPQFDIRGDGGYIIAPPSIHHETGKPYRVVQELPWAPAPSVLFEPKNSSNGSAHVSDAILQGHRHQTMLSIAGALRARHLSREMVLAQLRLANDRQCVPPLDDSELQKLADYVGHKPSGFPGSRPQETSAEVELECFDKIVPEQVRWLWDKRVPLGKLTIFAGDPGQGKSLITIDIAARMSLGTSFPDGARCEVGETIFLSAEDDAADTIRPRLDAAGADVPRIHRIKAVKVTLADGAPSEAAFSLERDIEKLDETIAKVPAVRLLVIDPINAYMGHIDTHRDADVRRVLMPLSELAARRRIAVIVIMHLKKSETSALLRVSGSIGFVAAARCVWGFGEDPSCPGKRVMVAVKNNLAALGEGTAYRIEAFQNIPHVVWMSGEVHARADEILCGEKERRETRTRRKEAEQWVRDFDLNGKGRPVSEIKEEATKAGIAWRTIERARECLPIRTVKIAGQWCWVLDIEQGEVRQ
jgi:putative DNA primase/helicase